MRHPSFVIIIFQYNFFINARTIIDYYKQRLSAQNYSQKSFLNGHPRIGWFRPNKISAKKLQDYWRLSQDMNFHKIYNSFAYFVINSYASLFFFPSFSFNCV